MPRAVAVILDKGGAEPYSDSNPPGSLERTLAAAPGSNPPAGESVEWTTDGKSLDMRAPDGTVTRIGPSAGGGTSTSIAPVLANVAAVATEVVVARFDLPAGYLAAGSLLTVRFLGQLSGNATVTYRVRVGPLGTTADPLAIAFAASAAGAANAHTNVDALVACLTAGATGTVTASGQARVVSGVVGPATAAFAAATVNTTVAQRVSLTAQLSAAQTLTSRAGGLSKVV